MFADGPTDDERKMITIAHPEHNSCDLKIVQKLVRVVGGTFNMQQTTVV